MSSITCVGIVGGGTMGSGIAYEIIRRAGLPVMICEESDDAIVRARATLERLVARPMEKGQVDHEVAAGWLANVHYTEQIESLAEADIVIEAVFEDLEVKKRTFTRLDSICRPDTILASNTSGLPITQIAAATKHPERVLGLHFFNPVPAMKLVEVIRAYQTSDETLERAIAFCHTLQKETILAQDYPGFITTRIGFALIAEAMRCFEEHVGSVEDIDIGMKLAYNHPMGPLKLADLVGLDIVLHILESLHHELGEQFRPSPLLKQMVAAGHLGKKSGEGFYSY